MDGQKLTSRPVISTSQGSDKIHVVRNGISYQQEARFFKPETLQNNVVGGVNFIGGMDYFVWASQYTINNIVYNSYVSGIVTIDDGGTNNRFDRFVVEVNTLVNPTTSSISVVKGTESASPVLPVIDAETQIEISFVLVEAGQSDNDSLVTSLIYDENTGEPNEWDNISKPVGGNLDYNIDPFTGLKSYRGDATDSAILSWRSNQTYTFDSTSKLSFAYKGQLTETSKLSIKLINSSDSSYWLNTILLSNINDYGYNDIAAGWQVLEVKLSDFTNNNVNNNLYDTLELKFINTPTIDLDRINIQTRLAGDQDDSDTITVEDNLTSFQTTNALSANQGRILNDKIEMENPFTVVFKSPSGLDDSIAVNAAISNLPIINGDKSGHIKFGDGVWDFQSPLNLDGNNNITLSGNGGATVFTSSVGGIIIQSYKTDFSSRVNENVVIENILFKGDDILDTTAISMRVRHNSIIRNCFFKGQTLTGFDGQDLNNVKIINNDFVDVNYGVILEAVTYDIEDFIIKGNDMSYILSNAIKIDGSNSLQSTGAQKIIITNNTIEECDLGGINLIEVFSSTISDNTISQCIDYLIRAQDGNNLQISNNILKEALNSGNGVTFIDQSASNIINNTITDVVNAISFDANSSANIAKNNGRLNIEDLSEENFYTKQDGSGTIRPIEHTYGGQARFKSRASSTGGGFTDIHYLFESQLDNRNMAVALNAPIGQDARLYFNRDRTRGWVFHYQTTNDFDLFFGADEVIRFKDDLDVRIYYNLEIDDSLTVTNNADINGNIELNGFHTFTGDFPNDGTGVSNGSMFKGVSGDLYYKDDSGTVTQIN